MGKRGNGEGSIYRRTDGRWCGQVMLGKKRRTIYGRTRRDVQVKLRKLLADADRGLWSSPQRLTVAEYLDRWLEDIARLSVKKRTWEGYSDIVRVHLVSALGELKLTSLQPAHIQNLYGSLLAKGLTPKTVRNIHSVLHSALAQAVAWDLMSRNAADAVRLPKSSRPEMKVLTPEQARTLLRAAGETRFGPILTLAVATGMRQGELLGLQWQDVDLEAGRLHVRRQLGRDRAFTAPKSGKGTRSIALPEAAISALKAHRLIQCEERRLLGPDYEDLDLVFCTQCGTPIPYTTLAHSFKRLLVRAGLPDMRFHDLRHTAATFLFLQGVHPKVVQERLGHSQVSITLDTYSHLLPSMDRAAADGLNALLE